MSIYLPEQGLVPSWGLVHRDTSIHQAVTQANPWGREEQGRDTERTEMGRGQTLTLCVLVCVQYTCSS